MMFHPLVTNGVEELVVTNRGRAETGGGLQGKPGSAGWPGQHQVRSGGLDGHLRGRSHDRQGQAEQVAPSPKAAIERCAIKDVARQNQSANRVRSVNIGAAKRRLGFLLVFTD